MFSNTQEEIGKFEMIDKMFFRKVLKDSSTTPVTALFLELGIIPVKFIIQARRIMYLHYLLNLHKEDLLFKVFEAQTDDPIKNDWCQTVAEDLIELRVEMNHEEIKKMPKEVFKSIIKKKCKEAALDYLKNEKEKVQSKMGKLKYKKLTMQKYLMSKKLTTTHKKLLFKLRCRMVNVGKNFGRADKCKLCKIEDDSQQHLIECTKIKEKVPEVKRNTKVKHDHIYSKSIKEKIEVVKLFDKAISAKKIMLEKIESLT